MRIIVVGGSIAGSASARYLSGAGHDVTLYESAHRLRSRGIAVGTAAETMQSMIDTGLLPPEFPHCKTQHLTYVARGVAGEEVLLGSSPLSWATMRWGDLHRALVRGVPTAAYRHGSPVQAIRPGSATQPAVRFEGRWHDADLIVAADGHRSLAHDALGLHSTRRYTGLALLRGLVDEKVLEGSDVAGATLDDCLTRTMFEGGHAVSYYVPGRNGSTDAGARGIMWGVYVRLDEKQIARLSTAPPSTSSSDAPEGAERALAVSAPQMRTLLHDIMPSLPRFWQTWVDRAEAVHLQPVYDAKIDSLYRGRVCLVGDAGSVYPPFNGNGVMKAVRMSASLAAALPPTHAGKSTNDADDLDDVLTQWSTTELHLAAGEHAAASALRNALTDAVPDRLLPDEESVRHWLADVT